MTNVKRLCLLLIQRGRTDGLQEKLDAFLLVDRITLEEYNELVKMISDTNTTEE